MWQLFIFLFQVEVSRHVTMYNMDVSNMALSFVTWNILISQGSTIFVVKINALRSANINQQVLYVLVWNFLSLQQVSSRLKFQLMHFFRYFTSLFSFFCHQDYKCIVLSWSLAKTIAVVRSLTDFIYLLHILLQVSKDQLHLHEFSLCIKDDCFLHQLHFKISTLSYTLFCLSVYPFDGHSMFWVDFCVPFVPQEPAFPLFRSTIHLDVILWELDEEEPSFLCSLKTTTTTMIKMWSGIYRKA